MKIVVINPNSSADMTKDINDAVQRYTEGRFEAIVLPTPGAPEFIDTFEDKALAAPGMMQLVRSYENEADSFVVACACDPNLKLMREITKKPVIGIGEASMYIAAMLGRSFTILQTDSYSVPNKVNLVHEYHMEENLASVKVACGEQTGRFDQYLTAARRAMERDGAEVIILGCAGLCDMANRLSEKLGIPVLDGVACGLSIAESVVRLGYTTSKARYYSAAING
ncbi:aspartate/glutamate racemase family protein [Cloacibacillus porcorum]